MISQYTLPLDREEMEDRLTACGEEPEIFFVSDGHDPELVYVPGVHLDAFTRAFPEARHQRDITYVPIFWTFQSALYRGDPRHVEHIGANAIAMHGTGAVAVGHNCEHELTVIYGYGSGRKLPGFYHELGGKQYIFAAVGIEGDDETEGFLLTLYEHDSNLVGFLRQIRPVSRGEAAP